MIFGEKQPPPPHHLTAISTGPTTVQIDDKLVVRPYTPVSANSDIGYFDLVLKVYFKDVNPRFPEGGKMSQYLNSLSIGSTVDVRGPTGHVTYLGAGTLTVADPLQKKAAPQKRKAKKIGFVAGGTGITPILQILRHVLKEHSKDIEMWLLFANQVLPPSASNSSTRSLAMPTCFTIIGMPVLIRYLHTDTPQLTDISSPDPGRHSSEERAARMCQRPPVPPLVHSRPLR